MRLFVLTLMALLGMAAYIASPFYAAWTVREAVRTGDAELLAHKFDWPAVRASMRSSIMRAEDLRPEFAAAGRQIRPNLWQRVKRWFGEPMVDRFIDTYITPAGLTKLYHLKHDNGGRLRRSDVGRMAVGAAPAATRAEVHRALAARRARTRQPINEGTVNVAPPRPPRVTDDMVQAGAGRRIDVDWSERWVRIREFVARLRSARFVDLTTVMIDIRDQNRDDRHYVSRMELRGLDWVVTSVEVRKLAN